MSDRATVEVKDDARFFVWRYWCGLYHPQIWFGDQKTGTGQFQNGKIGTGGLAAFHTLEATDRRELSELAKDTSLMPEALKSLLADVTASFHSIPVFAGDLTEGFQ